MVGITAMAIAYVLSQFFRSFMAVLTPALTAELGAGKVELSIASGAWFAAFALMQFVVGASLDRRGPKRTAALISGLGCGGGAFLFAAATKPWMIIAGMALIGAGCAPVLMAGIFIFARSFPPARLAVLTSWFIAFGSLGNVLGTTPLARTAEAFGWRPVVFAMGVLSVLTALAIQMLVRDPPQAESSPGANRGFSGYVEVARLRSLWPIIPLVGMNYAPMIGILGLWAGPYLTDVHGADALVIGKVTFFMALAVIAGNFLYGPLDTIFGTRKWVAFFGNLGSAVVLVWMAILPQQSIAMITVALCLLAAFGTSFALLMAHARGFIPVHLTGRGITLLNFFSIGGVGLAQFLSGWVVEGLTRPDQPAFAYSALFAFYAFLVIAALLIYLRMPDVPPERDVIRPGTQN